MRESTKEVYAVCQSAIGSVHCVLRKMQKSKNPQQTFNDIFNNNIARLKRLDSKDLTRTARKELQHTINYIEKEKGKITEYLERWQ